MIQTEIRLGDITHSFPREELSEGYKIPSIALVCPVCVQIWGRCTIPGSSLWVPEMVSCEACDWSDILHPVPGSIISNNHPTSGVDWALLDALPEELLRREFNLTVRNYEARYQSHEDYISSQITLLHLPLEGEVASIRPGTGLSYSSV